MKITTILFDIGGVLARTVDRHPRTLIASKLGLTYQEMEKLVFNSPSGRAAQLGEITTAENWEFVRQELGLTPEELPRVHDLFFAGDILDTALVEKIRVLQPHYTTAVLSNMSDFLRPLITDHWRIADAFDHLFISCELGLMKPDPRIYHHVIDALGIAPQEAVFVDDFAHNIQSAREVGMHGIQFLNTEQAMQELDELLN